MIPKQITKGGKRVWFLDARSDGCGRLHAQTRERVLAKYRDALAGTDSVQFTDQDRLAKQELGERGTLLEAVRHFLAHGHGANIKQQISKAIEECAADKKQKNKRRAYVAHLRQILSQFKTFTGDALCSEISSRHIDRFLYSKPWSGSARQAMRSRLSAFFTFCRKQGYCTLNPVENVEIESVEKKRPTIFTVEQVQRLLDTTLHLDPWLLPYFVLGIFCGIRPEELQRLPQACIKLEQGIVDIPDSVSKTRDRRVVEISENARAWLRAVNKPLSYSRPRRRQIISLAHIEWSSDVMRHTFASYHVVQHQSADKTALELGHEGSTRMLFKHYRSTVSKEDAAAFWSLEPVVPLRVLAPAATGTEG